MSDLDKILSPKIIPCVAGIWSPINQYCLKKEEAVQIINITGTRALVLHIPPKNNYVDNNSLNFEELIEDTLIPLSDMVLLFNTSCCTNLKCVERVIKHMKYINSEYIDEFQHPLHSFLKLEILDSNLYPNDLHTLEII